MHVFELLAERKIEEAVSRGELEHLPGEGRPLDLEEDLLVPEDLRLAYRSLKIAGFVPAELEQINEMGALERLVCADPSIARAARKLALLKTRVERQYYDRALRRLR